MKNHHPFEPIEPERPFDPVELIYTHETSVLPAFRRWLKSVKVLGFIAFQGATVVAVAEQLREVIVMAIRGRIEDLMPARSSERQWLRFYGNHRRVLASLENVTEFDVVETVDVGRYLTRMKDIDPRAHKNLVSDEESWKATLKDVALMNWIGWHCEM